MCGMNIKGQLFRAEQVQMWQSEFNSTAKEKNMEMTGRRAGGE